MNAYGLRSGEVPQQEARHRSEDTEPNRRYQLARISQLA